MGEFLTEKQREELKYCHRMEDNLRYGDRIKAVLLLDSGWALPKISEALLLNEKTIRNYKKLYEEGVDRLCCDELQGRICRLSEESLGGLQKHLEENLYSTTAEIVAYVEESYEISYSISGMTDLLHRIGFVYKKTKIVPGKADPEKQREFLDNLEKLKESKTSEDKIYYLDGVHPQHNSQAACGWILKGKEKKLKSNTGRKRINLNGALDADTHEVIIREDSTINAALTAQFQQPIVVYYDKQVVGEFTADIIVENIVIVELKSVRRIVKAHELQLVNYLIATGKPVGLILNFAPNKVEIKRKVKVLD